MRVDFNFWFNFPVFSLPLHFACQLIQGELPSFQEGYMEVVNPFILKNKERMIVFLDQLSSITDPYMPPGGLLDISNNANTVSDPGKWQSIA